MSNETRLDNILAEIARLRSALAALQEEADNVGQFIHCCMCNVRVLIPGGQRTPRGWLDMWCHSSGDSEHYCPDHWNAACLDDTDSWFSGGQQIHLPFDEAHNLDEAEWRRIMTQFGAN